MIQDLTSMFRLRLAILIGVAATVGTAHFNRLCRPPYRLSYRATTLLYKLKSRG